jgi:hypothetical protein
VRAWTAANQEEAKAWLNALPDERFRRSLWSAYYGGVAETDLNAAIAAVEAIKPSDRHYFLWDLAPRVLQQGGIPGGEAWLEQVVTANKGQQESLDHVRGVFGQVSKKVLDAHIAAGQPLKIYDWLDKYFPMVGMMDNTLIIEAMKAGIARDPAGTMTALIKRPQPNQFEAVTYAVGTWMKQDRPAFQAWLADAQDSPHYDTIATPFIQDLIRERNGEAKTWIESLADPAARQRYLQQFEQRINQTP